MTDELKPLHEPDGKLHDDGCFTWNRGKEPPDRNRGFAGWRRDFYLVETVAALESKLKAAEARHTPDVQAAIDAALENVVQEFGQLALGAQPLPELSSTHLIYSPEANTWRKAIARIRSRIGTNQLAEQENEISN